MMVEQRHRPCWDNVERGVMLALRCVAEAVRLYIELRSVR